MPIFAYVGTPGAGKSHECVKSVILKAVLSGRRVVTNIDGINPDKIYSYCISKFKSDKSSLGVIHTVTDEQVISEGFFPFKSDTGYDGSGFVQPGDLVCLDEVWRFWDTDSKLLNNHRDFISEHRHFEHPESGLSCDIVFMNQSLDTMARFIKSRIESTFRMSKLNSLGLSKRYRVDVFTGAKLFKSSKVSSFFSKYDSDIFDLYKSTSGGAGLNAVVDSRQSLFKNKIFTNFIILSIIVCFISYFAISRFLHSHDSKNSHSESTTLQSNNSFHSDSSPADIPSRNKPSGLSSVWRITGVLSRGGVSSVILVNSSGDFRLVSSYGFTGTGVFLTGTVDGSIVTFYSGGSK